MGFGLTSCWIPTLVFRTFGGELGSRFANGCPLSARLRAGFEFWRVALLPRLAPRPELHPAVLSALEHFRRNPARPGVGIVAREVGLSKRRFIDVFNFQVGVKPKLFLRIQRFQRVLQKVHLMPVVDWGQLALEQGYFDQSHLIRDFVAFSGLSPADYLRRLHDLLNDGTHPIEFNHLPAGWVTSLFSNTTGRPLTYSRFSGVE